MEAIEELAVQPCTSSLYLRPFRLSYRQVSGAGRPPAVPRPGGAPQPPPAPFWSSAAATSWHPRGGRAVPGAPSARPEVGFEEGRAGGPTDRGVTALG